MAYGEGLPLPDTLDAPHPRIKQLARRATVTPGGDACKYNDIIPLDHCPHDVQDMSGINHPRADLSKGQYGCVSQTLHIARKLLAWIPDNAGILMVPCCRGGSAFTQGVDGTFNVASGASETATRWGRESRCTVTCSPARKQRSTATENMLLAVCWMQGEFDMTGRLMHSSLRCSTLWSGSSVPTWRITRGSARTSGLTVCRGCAGTPRTTGSATIPPSTMLFMARTVNQCQRRTLCAVHGQRGWHEHPYQRPG